MPAPPRTPPEAVPDGTRERILGAALRVFARAGFDGAGTRDIASAAGANQGLIAYHFGGKEALWRAAVERGLEALVAAVEAAVPSGAPLPVALAACLPLLHEHAEVLRVVLHEAGHDGPRLRKLARGPLARAVARLRAALPVPSASGALDANAGLALGVLAAASAAAAAPLLLAWGVDVASPTVRRALADAVVSATSPPRGVGGEWAAPRARAVSRA